MSTKNTLPVNIEETLDTPTDSLFELTLLGSPMLFCEGRQRSLVLLDKPWALLVYLATEQKEHSREELAALLWPEMPTGKARSNLSTTLYILAGRTGRPDLLKATRTHVQWAYPHGETKENPVDIANALSTAPPSGCDRLHTPSLCPRCQTHLILKREILGRPFLDHALLPELPPFVSWVGSVREKVRHLASELDRLLAGEKEIAPATSSHFVENRPLTVLCAVPELPKDLPDDEILENLDPWKTAAEALISSRGGWVIQSRVREIVAYFGYPVSLEEAPRQAAMAALSLVAGPGITGQERILVRAGIHTGDASCDVRRAIPDATGRLLGEARQATAFARPGTVLVTEPTLLLLGGRFQTFTQEGPDGLRYHRLAGETSLPRRAGPPQFFVGREAEMESLREAWKKTSSGLRQILWVTGEAGIGKSALISSFIRHVRGTPSLVREYDCLPEHQRTPWSPIIRFLRRHLSFDDPGLTRDDRLYRAERYLLDLHLLPERELPLLLHFLGEPGRRTEADRELDLLSPDLLRRRIEAFLSDILSRLSDRNPLLVVIEDIHWADNATLALIEKSLDHLTNVPMAMLFSSRETAPLKAFSLPPPDLVIPLGRLPRAAGSTLVNRIARRSLPPGELRTILDMGDGVPLYLSEMARMASSRSKGGIPPTLRDLLASRIDTVDERQREVLRTAAILGISFREDFLRRVLGEGGTSPDWSATGLGKVLVALADQGLVDREIEEPPSWSFHHALVREAVLASLSTPARRSLHDRIARVFLRDFPETVERSPEDVAPHLEAAGRLEEAAEMWEKASERAAARGAWRDAFNHLEKALDLVRKTPDAFNKDRELSLLLAAGPIAVAIDGHGSATVAEIYHQAEKLSGATPGSPYIFPLQFGLWTTAFTRVGPLSARPLGEGLLELGRRSGNRQECLRAGYALGATTFWTGELDYSGKRLREALEYEESREEGKLAPLLAAYAEDPVMGALAYQCWVFGLQGDPDKGLAAADRAVARAEEISHPNSLGYALSFLTYLKILLEDPEGAEETALRSLKLADRYGYYQWELVARIAQLYATGSRESITECRTTVRNISSVLSGLSSLFFLVEAMTALRSGLFSEARETAREGLEESRRSGASVFDPEFLRIEGEALFALDPQRREEAAHLFRTAIAKASSSHAVLFAFRSALSLAAILPEETANLASFYGKILSGADRPEVLRAREILEIS